MHSYFTQLSPEEVEALKLEAMSGAAVQQLPTVCHGDCFPGIHCILQGQSTPDVALVPSYLAGTGTRVFRKGSWHVLNGTARAVDGD